MGLMCMFDWSFKVLWNALEMSFLFFFLSQISVSYAHFRWLVGTSLCCVQVALWCSCCWYTVQANVESLCAMEPPPTLTLTYFRTPFSSPLGAPPCPWVFTTTHFQDFLTSLVFCRLDKLFLIAKLRIFFWFFGCAAVRNVDFLGFFKFTQIWKLRPHSSSTAICTVIYIDRFMIIYWSADFEWYDIR